MRALPYVLAVLVLGAGAVAFFHTDRPPEPRPSAADVAPADPKSQEPQEPQEMPTELPPDHPAVNGSHAEPMGVENEEPAALAWTVPPGWQRVPNPNPMRLATFYVGASDGGDDGAEVTIARAGGSADENVARWARQFEGAPTPKRSDRKVHGIDVVVAEVSGTYGGGAMMMPGAPPDSHPDWTLVGAIAQPAEGATYFFKLLGPSAKVRRARASFDAFLASLTPR